MARENMVALRNGFAAGLSSPYRLFASKPSRSEYEPRDFVSLSWERVGTAMRTAVESERPRIGKTSKPRPQTSR